MDIVNSTGQRGPERPLFTGKMKRRLNRKYGSVDAEERGFLAKFLHSSILHYACRSLLTE